LGLKKVRKVGMCGLVSGFQIVRRTRAVWLKFEEVKNWRKA